MRFLKRLLKRSLIFFVVVYVGLCAYLWHQQRSMMYFPEKDTRTAQEHGLFDFTDVMLTTADGTRVQLWQHEAQEGYPTIVYFHGNGGNIGYRAGYYQMMARSGFGVLALSYRGYGASEGSPSEAGFYNDARAVVQYATDALLIPAKRLVLYGESIGTGVAVQMATEYPVGAIVLQAPYTSIADVAQAHFAWMPVRLLLTDRFDSLSKIEKINAPLLVVHGERDRIIPVVFGKKLYDAAQGPKSSVWYPTTDHNDFDLRAVLSEVLAFASAQGLIAP